MQIYTKGQEQKKSKVKKILSKILLFVKHKIYKRQMQDQ